MDNLTPPSPVDTNINVSKSNTPKQSVPPHKRLKWIFFKPEHVSRKKWLLVDAAIVLLIGLATVSAIALYKHLTRVPKNTPVAKVARVPKTPAVVPSRLTGLPVAANLNDRPITGVMIENSPDARPQSGLLEAGIVYEAIAEGGITRFMALYEEAQPDYIGPVRSVRPYYLEFALPFQASVAHVGGSPEGLSQVKSLHIRDLDEFANAGAYQRISQRYAPHNVYTSSAKLDALEKTKGYDKSTFTSFPRKKDQPSAAPTAKSIDMAISSFYYNAHYSYDTKTDSYFRSEASTPHIDDRTHKQLNPKVVIALVMKYSIESDGKHSQYQTTGTGTAYIFQDGVVYIGTWRKDSSASQISFVDGSGKPISLNAGQTWISLVGQNSNVIYKP